MLNEFHHIPDALLTANTEDLFELLQRPTLIHLEGRQTAPLFISTLLHGNETTGFYALQELLKRHQHDLPRSLSIFIGNVEAAASGKRMLDSQADYNRVWPGTAHPHCAEADIMQTVTRNMRPRRPFASIDIHNNTGRNPHYACINVLSTHSLQLASRFSEKVVYFTSPKGVQSSAFAEFCPAVVLECGQSTDADSVDHAVEYLERIINLEQLPGDHPDDINIYHTVARVMVPAQYSIGRGHDNDIIIDPAFEDMNFSQLDIGTGFVQLKGNSRLIVLNESNEDVMDDFFANEEGKLLLRKEIILSMFTEDVTAIKQDVLCYFMERLKIQP